MRGPEPVVRNNSAEGTENMFRKAGASEKRVVWAVESAACGF